MTQEERVQAVMDFTERQARFLVFVLSHAGVCVPHQYATLAGARGSTIDRMISSADPFFSSRSSMRASIDAIAIYARDVSSERDFRQRRRGRSADLA